MPADVAGEVTLSVREPPNAAALARERERSAQWRVDRAVQRVEADAGSPPIATYLGDFVLPAGDVEGIGIVDERGRATLDDGMSGYRLDKIGHSCYSLSGFMDLRYYASSFLFSRYFVMMRPARDYSSRLRPNRLSHQVRSRREFDA